MKEEIELKLVEEFPRLLKGYRGDPTETCLAFGLECGNGWAEIIHKCCEQLDALDKLDKSLSITIDQIKEKFGELRIYLTTTSDNPAVSAIAYSIVRNAELCSQSTCEVSGMYGSLCRRGMWYKTLSFDIVNAKDSEFSLYVPTNERTKEDWNRRIIKQQQEEETYK